MLDTVKSKPVNKYSPSWAIERRLLRLIYERLGRPAIGFTLWDGYNGGKSGNGDPGIYLHNRRALWRLLSNPQLHFGEDYSRGLISIQGDLVALLQEIYRARLEEAVAADNKARRRYSIHPGKARRNAAHHYDIGNDFYRLWLDEEMVYTCAYYPQTHVSLEQAQQAKLEHICRKLQLKKGETVFEAGCGWGALSRYMARHYGVRVKACNVSHAQIEWARQRTRQEGLADQVEFIEDDYRNLSGQCDVFVSIGMLEHVGPRHYATLGQVIDRVLVRDGRGLIHTIAQNQPERTNPWIQRYIFPDGRIPTLREMMDIFEPQNFSIVDLENLRLHYAMTLQQWLVRFEQQRDKIGDLFDEAFVRMWRLYLAGSIANFTSGSLQLYQVLFQRPALDSLPITRDHLYRQPLFGTS